MRILTSLFPSLTTRLRFSDPSGTSSVLVSPPVDFPRGPTRSLPLFRTEEGRRVDGQKTTIESNRLVWVSVNCFLGPFMSRVLPSYRDPFFPYLDSRLSVYRSCSTSSTPALWSIFLRLYQVHSPPPSTLVELPLPLFTVLRSLESPDLYPAPPLP